MFQNTVDQLTSRTLTELLGSDTMETPTYTGPGINSSTFKPFDWIKQKKDKFINGDVVYKTRNIIEPLIFPTAKIIEMPIQILLKYLLIMLNSLIMMKFNMIISKPHLDVML